MKIGLGLYRHMLTPDNFRFAKQAGATHIVAHLVDYFKGGGGHSASDDQPMGTDRGWGLAGDPNALWAESELVELRKSIEAEGLKLEAIENFDPAHWHDILLDGPQRAKHIENVKTIIRRMGAAGIPIMGYNFSLAGVAGRVTLPGGRGGAPMVGTDGPYDLPMPNGMVWNMVYDPNAREGNVATITHEELWRRLTRFLEEVLPVAEASGVQMAAHPDDPPMPFVRGQPRLVYQPQMYQRLLDAVPSPSNKLEFCVGSLAEMTEGDIYETVDQYSRQGALGYVHLRNIRGKAPHYRETFIDEGDVDVLRVLRILKENGFEGVIIPDHAPQMTCEAPWHSGMAYAMGFLKAGMMSLESGFQEV